MASRREITLSELQRSIQETLVGRFALPIWISAEISDLKVNGSGHCYMELVEKGSSDGVARAQARGVIWRSGYSAIAARFEAETGTRLERGITILARCLVNYHELHGLSLQISDIDPSFTIGASERERQLAIMKLKQNESWDKNRELPLPNLVQRVAVISSSQAAGYQDFIREISKSEYHFEITLFEAVMQGEAAEQSMIDALIAIANRRTEFDIVAVIRGGGSSNDLNCFNSYRLALHFARFPLPLISGIGHDKDISVVDMVAQIMMKTPTAVAGWFAERMLILDSWLIGAAQQLHTYSIERSRGEEKRLEGYSRELLTRTEELMNRKKRELIERLERIPDAAAEMIEQRRKELNHAATVVEGYSPERLLAIGFSIARQADTGRGIKSIEEVEIGNKITLQLPDGEVGATITSKHGGETNL